MAFESTITEKDMDSATQTFAHAVRGDKPDAGILVFPEHPLQIPHIAMFVNGPPGLAQTHAVDDARMVQRIADDRIFGSQQGLEEPRIGIEAG